MNHIFHVIKDPVHGSMQFSALENQWVKPFIDDPHFQRLRHIKQMGLGDFIFPGAVHTRFNHCLGCAYVASQIAQKIGLAEEERQLVIIASLLHDIGHGPFSHTFEDLFIDKVIHHESWTPLFLADYCTPNFFQQFNTLNPRYPLTEEKFNEITHMIMHKPTHRRVLADIVSSQLDADRLDYLLRDSHFCGVRYGEFDFRWMIHCLAIVETPQGERLGITHKGIGVVEHYLMARRLMMRNIYHHQKKLALEYFLVQLLRALAENVADFSLFADIKRSRLGRFLIKTKEFNEEAKQTTAREPLIKRFLHKNYPDYRELCDYDVFSAIRALTTLESDHAAVILAKRIYTRTLPKIFRLDTEQVPQVRSIIESIKADKTLGLQDWQLALMQAPHQSYSGCEDPILVVNEKKKIKPLGEISFMIEALSDRKESSAFLVADKMITQDKKIMQQLVGLLD